MCVCAKLQPLNTATATVTRGLCASDFFSKENVQTSGKKKETKRDGVPFFETLFFFQAIVQPHSKAQSHRKSKFRREIKHCITKQDLKKKNLESQKVPRKDLLIISPFIKLSLLHEGSSLQNSSLFSLSSLRYFTSLTRAQKKNSFFELQEQHFARTQLT